MTPYGHPDTQYPQPLQMSCCTTTVPNSVRNSAPVGQTSRHPACVQCLQTSLLISQRKSVRVSTPDPSPGRCRSGMPRSIGARSSPSVLLASAACSMNATCRHEFAPRLPVLSNDRPSRLNPSSGTPFHSLQATSQALHPMHTDVSVKKPT